MLRDKYESAGRCSLSTGFPQRRVSTCQSRKTMELLVEVSNPDPTGIQLSLMSASR